MKKFLQLMLLAVLLVPLGAKAQITSLPDTMGFEGTDLQGWTMNNCHSSTGINASAAHSGSSGFRFYYTTNYPQYLISPRIENQTDMMSVSFWYKNYSSSYSETFQFGWSSTDSLPASFTWDSEVTASNQTWTMYEAVVPAGTQFVSIRCNSNDQFYLFIDDIIIAEPPTCFRVQSIAAVASSITSDGMTLTWVDTINTSTTYTLTYWPAGATDAIDTVVETGLSGNSYELTGLEAATTYYFSIVPDCGADGSVLPCAGSAKTDCAGGSCLISAYVTDSYNDSWNGNTIDIVQNGGVMGTIECPYGSSGSTYTYQVCSGVPVQLIYNSGNYPNEMGGYITDGGGTTVFTIENMSSMGDTLATIANPCPSCIAPVLTVDTVTENSITVSWASTDAQVDLYIDDTPANVSAGDTTHTFDNLNPNTAYVIGIQAVCEANVDSSSLITRSVRTACGATPIPYMVNFANETELPSCWEIMQSYDSWGSSYPMVYSSLYFYATSDDSNLVRLPFFAAEANAMVITVTGYVEENYVQSLQVGYLTNPDSASTFVALGAITASEATEYTFNTAAVTADSIWLALRLTAPGDEGAGLISSIEISRLSSCARPDLLVVDTMTNESVSLRWNNTGADNYDVRISTNSSGSNPIIASELSDTVTTITGLTPSTTYYTWVRSLCSSDSSDWRQGPSFTTYCGEDPCFITIDMVDSYGDGWNGNGIQIYRNNNLFTTATIENGNTGFYSMAVCDADTVVMKYVLGSFPSEVSFTITYAGMATQFTGQVNGTNRPTGDTLLSVIGCPSCYSVQAVVAEATGATTATLHWTPNDPADDNFAIYSNGVYVTTVTGDTTYTINTLTANTNYIFGVAHVCGNDTTDIVSAARIATDCGENGSCDVIVEMSADYINTWLPGNNWIEVYSDSTLRGTATLPRPYNAGTAEIAACVGDSLHFTWHAGTPSWGQYDHFIIFNANGDTLYQGDGLSATTRLVDTVLICPSCAKPAEVTVTTTTTTATLAMSPAAASWIVVVGDDTISTTTSPVTISGLLAGHNYSALVYAVCANGDTSLAKGVKFATDCEDVTLPWVEDFETYAIDEQPACWHYINVEDLGSRTFPFVTELTDSVLALYSRVYQKIDSQYTVTPLIPLPANKIHAVFKAYGYSYGYAGSAIDAGIMTNPADMSTYIPLVEIEQDGDNLVYEMITDNLTLTDTAYIAFRAKSASSSEYVRLLIDSLAVKAQPDCARPLTIAISDTANTSATVTWASTGATAYQVFVNGSLFGTPTTNTFALTGLTPNTAYTVMVRAICTDTSLFSPAATFRTACGAMPMPFSENFESYANYEVPSCWLTPMTVAASTGQPTPCVYNYSYYAHAGENSLLMRAKSGNASVALSPEISGAVNAVHVSFWHRGSTTTNIEAGVVFDDTTYVTLFHKDSTGSTYRQYSFTTLDSLANDQHTVFRVFLRATTANTSVQTNYVDDLIVQVMPDCAETFASISVDSLTGNSAALFFESGLGVNANATYTVTLMNANDAVLSTINNVTESPVSLTGLTPQTTYHVAVSMTCGGSVTAVSDTIAFTTRCAGAAVSEVSSPSSTAGSYYPVYPFYNHSFSQAIYPDSLLTAGSIESLSVNCSTANGTLTGFRGRIWLKEVPDSVNTVAAWYQPEDMTLVYDGNLPLEHGWNEFMFDTPFAYSGDGNLLVFMMADVNGGSYVSGYNFYRHSAPAATTRYYYNDNITWEQMTSTGTAASYRADMRFNVCAEASCQAPAIEEVNAAETEISFNITSDASSFEVAIVEGAWEDDPVTGIISVTTTTYTFSGLTASTTYTIGVRADCGDGLLSDWTTTSVTTADHPCMMPTGVTVSGLTLDGGTISWTPGEEGQTDFEVRIYNNTYDSTVAVSNATSVTMTGLYSDVDYNVVVRAVCGDNNYSDWTEPVTLTPSLCEAPTNLTATAEGRVVTLTWQGSADRYRVVYYDEFHTINDAQHVDVEENTATVTVPEGGMDYTFAVQAYCGNALSGYSPVEVVSIVGIDAIEGSNINLYPNPAASKVTLSGISGTATVTMVDLNGRECGKWNVSDGQLTIDLTSYAKGAYFVRIAGERSVAIRKLIVK